MKDRIKDVNDPVAHPVLFFRRKKELPHKKVEYLTGLPAGSRLVITDEDGMLKERLVNNKNQINKTNINSQLRPSSANPAGPAYSSLAN